MHALHFDPRRILIAALAAFILALLAAAWLPSALDGVSFGGSGSAASATTSSPTPAPVWRTDPLASPLSELTTP